MRQRKATHPAEFMFANTANHSRTAIQFFDEASALRAVCSVEILLIAPPLFDALFCLAAAPLAVILLLTELTGVRLTHGAGGSTAPAGRTKIDDRIAVRLRAEHQVFSVLGHQPISPEVSSFLEHFIAAKLLHLKVRDLYLAAMLWAYEIIKSLLLLN